MVVFGQEWQIQDGILQARPDLKVRVDYRVILQYRAAWSDYVHVSWSCGVVSQSGVEPSNCSQGFIHGCGAIGWSKVRNLAEQL
jgi:hypothetical protein